MERNKQERIKQLEKRKGALFREVKMINRELDKLVGNSVFPKKKRFTNWPGPS